MRDRLAGKAIVVAGAGGIGSELARRYASEGAAVVIGDIDGLEAVIVETRSYAGGGAMPMHPLPSRALALRAAGVGADDLARRLRAGATPVVGRIERDRVLLDLRTVADGELPALAGKIRSSAPG